MHSTLKVVEMMKDIWLRKETMMRRSWNYRPVVSWLLPVLVVVSVVGILEFQKSFAAPATAPQIGYRAPQFTLTDLNGKKMNLGTAVNRNRITLVNFWATWCPPCRAEIPELVKFYGEYKTKGVALLAVNLQESPEAVKAFAGKNGMRFPVLLDSSGKVAQVYQVYAIPTTFILDRHGVIRDLIQGSINLATLQTKVGKLLAEK
ncbi:MAG TPA: TlpA disulfide reductase family protein [Bacillota bacterium]